MIQNKFWQGFFALAPLIGLVLFLMAYAFFIFALIGNMAELEGDGDPSGSFFGSLGLIVGVVFVWILLSIGSLIFYIVHASQNPNLRTNNMLLVWILLFLFASGIGQLIYWIVEILGKRNSQNP